MEKKFLVARTQELQSWFIVIGAGETMFGTSSLAGSQDLTLPAPSWQGRLLADAEMGVQRFLHHERQGIGQDVAEPDSIMREKLIVNVSALAYLMNLVLLSKDRKIGFD